MSIQCSECSYLYSLYFIWASQPRPLAYLNLCSAWKDAQPFTLLFAASPLYLAWITEMLSSCPCIICALSNSSMPLPGHIFTDTFPWVLELEQRANHFFLWPKVTMTDISWAVIMGQALARQISHMHWEFTVALWGECTKYPLLYNKL